MPDKKSIGNSIKDAFDKLPPLVKILIVAAVIFILWRVIVWAKDYFEKLRQQKLLEGSKKEGVTEGGQIVQIDLGTKAAAIYGAFYNNDWFGWTEDEETAITEVMSVPKSLMPDLSSVYFKLYNENLKVDFQSYLSSDDYSRISSQFA